MHALFQAKALLSYLFYSCLTLTMLFTHTPDVHEREIANELKWIASLQLPSGVIVDNVHAVPNEPFRASPYFANMASMALLEKPEYVPAVHKYFAWYFKHLNQKDKYGLSGTIYDYMVYPDGREKSVHHYDSSDSYSSTFLMLLRKYYEQTGDDQLLLRHRQEIGQVAGNILQTMDHDLSWAHPGWEVKYLMDNSEVYVGLRDYAYLASVVFKDEAEAKRYGEQAARTKRAIEETYLKKGSLAHYLDAKWRGEVRWPIWYADTTSMMFPIAYGILPPSDQRAAEIYNKLNEYHPGWVHAKPELAPNDRKDPFPWVVVGYASAKGGDVERCKTFVGALQKTYISQGHPWPWTSAESAWYVRMNQELHRRESLRWY